MPLNITMGNIYTRNMLGIYNSQLCQAGLTPSAGTRTETKPYASSGPTLVPQQKEIIEDQAGETKVLREEKQLLY